MELWLERLLCGVLGFQDPPYRAAAIAVLGPRAYWIASLEREVWLDAMDGRKVVVLDLA